MRLIKRNPDPERFGTNALFNCVAADKYINTDSTREPEYPNIGAFRINSDTETYITNVFGALTMNWRYLLRDKEVRAYSKIISRYYSREAGWLFEKALQMNRLSLSHKLK